MQSVHTAKIGIWDITLFKHVDNSNIPHISQRSRSSAYPIGLHNLVIHQPLGGEVCFHGVDGLKMYADTLSILHCHLGWSTMESRNTLDVCWHAVHPSLSSWVVYNGIKKYFRCMLTRCPSFIVILGGLQWNKEVPVHQHMINHARLMNRIQQRVPNTWTSMTGNHGWPQGENWEINITDSDYKMCKS